MSTTLVAYFSASGVTKEVAKKLAAAISSDIYEIKPVNPYTAADLDWRNKSSRSTLEMNDHNSRPEIIQEDAHIENYDTIFLGFPIWWYIAPTIINTFLESYDFSDKKIILFATSGGSGFGRTINNLLSSVSDTAEIVEGKLLNYNPSLEDLKIWTESL